MLWLNGAITVGLIPWTILLSPGMPLAKLGEQVWYVTLISHVALILAGLSAFQAARVEVRQEREEAQRAEENGADLDKVESKVDDLHDKLG